MINMSLRSYALATVFFWMTASAAQAADVNVNQSHTSFDVDAVKVHKGDTVIFTNSDDVTHNIQVTNADGDNDDKGLQKPGDIIKASFPEVGTYKVHCAIHPKMKMVVTAQ